MAMQKPGVCTVLFRAFTGVLNENERYYSGILHKRKEPGAEADS